jgi:hypothetical protein
MSEPTTERKITFFDVSMAGVPAGRIVIQLYNDLVPKTAENFRPFISLSSTSTRTRSLITYIILIPSRQAHSALAKRALASLGSPYGTKTVVSTVSLRSARSSAT